MNLMIRNSVPYQFVARVVGLSRWHSRGYSAPSPQYIKQACLVRNGIPCAAWIETGTHLGATTRFLARHASRVYSIEPEPALYANAAHYLRSCRNVQVLHGTSEAVLPELLPTLSGDLNFWLDGHYSAGATFRGTQDTPIVAELACIAQHLRRFGRVAVLVDDVRCFAPQRAEFAGYPPIDFLARWSMEHGLYWHVEHDIFIAATGAP